MRESQQKARWGHDVTSENLVAQDCHVKLTDFGLSNIMDAGAA